MTLSDDFFVMLDLSGLGYLRTTTYLKKDLSEGGESRTQKTYMRGYSHPRWAYARPWKGSAKPEIWLIEHESAIAEPYPNARI